MKDFSERDVNIGDLIFYLPKKGYFIDIEYGLVVGKDLIFNGVKVISCLSNSFYLASLSEKELKIKVELVYKYQEYNNNKFKLDQKKKLNQNIIGDIYYDENKFEYSLYLGEYYISYNNGIILSDKKSVYVQFYYRDNDNININLFSLINNLQVSDEELIKCILSSNHNIIYKAETDKIGFKKNDLLLLLIQKSPLILSGKCVNHIDICRQINKPFLVESEVYRFVNSLCRGETKLINFLFKPL